MADVFVRKLVPLNICSLIYTVLTYLTSTKALSSRELCLSKVCSGCIAGSLSCQEGGLSRLPDQLSSDITSVILIGHRFDNDRLLKTNFSNYPQQTKELQRLTLRNCGVASVQPGAFQSLQSLTQLDLSQNKLQNIEAYTFSGLRLDLLRLDENRGLALAPGAFQDASIVSLSMNQCGLRSISYEDLAPLLKNGALTNLHLSGNKLISLESRLEPTFLALQSLSLDQNSFSCDCNLRWLSDVLRQRSGRKGVNSLNAYLSDEPPDLLRHPLNSASDLIPGAQLDGDLLKPVCRSPERLAGRWIENLNAKDFYCNLPHLKVLEIDLAYVASHQKTPKSLTAENDNRSSANGGLKVTLRCHVAGSPELQLAWYRYTDPQVITQMGIFNENAYLTKLPQSKLQKPGVSEVQLYSPELFPNSAIHNGFKMGMIPIERLVCVASDLSGNSSAEIRLHWPLPGASANTDKLSLNPQDVRTYPVAQGTQLENSAVETVDKQVTNTAELSHWYLLTGEDPNGFWLQKQFSALQMIGAVVGTFTITLFLFLVGFCLLKLYRVNKSCERSKLFFHNNNNSVYHQSSSNSKYTGLPSYSSVPTQQNSTIYPLNQSANTEVQNLYSTQLSQQLTSTTQLPQNEITAFDTNTNRRLPYATYEPVPLSELVMPVAYSDSQTYDVPQFPSAFSPPRLPLPPLPASNPSASAIMPTFELRTPLLTSTLAGHGATKVGLLNGHILSPLPGYKSQDHDTPSSATLNRLHQSTLMQSQSGLGPQKLDQKTQSQFFNFVQPTSAFNLHSQDNGS